MSEPTPDKHISIPSTSTIVDTMVATTLCKSIGDGFTGKLTTKNIGYLVLLSSIPDIKKLILDSIHSVKTFILNNFKSVLSKITHTQLYQLIRFIWNHTIGYFLKLIFKRAPKETTNCIEHFTPFQPRFETQLDIDFKDNVQIVENMVNIFKKNDNISTIKSLDMINKNHYCYEEVVSDLHCEKDDLLIKLNDPLQLVYESKNEEVTLKKFNGIDFGNNAEEKKLADELGLTLTKKPETVKKLTDAMDNRLIAAFMESKKYKTFSKTVNKIGINNIGGIMTDHYSIYNIHLKVNLRFNPLFEYFNVVNYEDKYLLLHDIVFYSILLNCRTYQHSSIHLKTNFINTNIFTIDFVDCNKKSINIFKFETNKGISNTYFHIDSKYQLNNCYNYLWDSINSDYDKIGNFLDSKKKVFEIKNKLTFNLSSLNPSLDLVSTFQKQFLIPLSKTVKSESKNISVYSVKIDTTKKIRKKPNPDYIKYMKKKAEIEKLADKVKDNSDLLSTFATLEIPDEEIEIVETEDKVVCTKENTLSKPFETLYLRKEDKDNLTSILHNFKNSKDLYEDLGLRRKIGIMLYGDPGTGKSTTIIATATYLNYDIYYVSVSNIDTNRQFKMIIDHINEKETRGGIIVMEDIDAQSEVFHKRGTSLESSTSNNIISLSERADDRLDLSYILNLFDGTLSRDNNVFMFTTNHLDKIDPAVYRTGRVDSLIHLKKCDHYQIEMIYNQILKRDINDSVLSRIKVDKWTPADIIFRVVKYFYRPDAEDEEIMLPFID